MKYQWKTDEAHNEILKNFTYCYGGMIEGDHIKLTFKDNNYAWLPCKAWTAYVEPVSERLELKVTLVQPFGYLGFQRPGNVDFTPLSCAHDFPGFVTFKYLEGQCWIDPRMPGIPEDEPAQTPTHVIWKEPR